MGGLGTHHVHPYAVQAAAFYLSLLFPASAFVLVAGAVKERFRRRAGHPASGPAATLATVRFAPLRD